MAERAEGEQFRGQWFAFPARMFLHDSDPDGPPVSIELRTASSPAVIEVSGGSIPTRLGTAHRRTLSSPANPQLLLAVLTGYLTAAQAADLGVQISGDASVLDRVLPQPVAA